MPKEIHPEAINALVRDLTVVAQNLVYPFGFTCAGARILEGTEETECFACTDEGCERQNKVLSHLLEKWGQKFSARYLDGKLTDIMRKVVAARSVEPIKSEVENLVRECEAYSHELEVVVPLAGVEMKMD